MEVDNWTGRESKTDPLGSDLPDVHVSVPRFEVRGVEGDRLCDLFNGRERFRVVGYSLLGSV